MTAPLCMIAPPLEAQDATWTGGNAGDPNEWVENNNWTPATVPAGTATFTSTGVTTVANDNGVVFIGNIQFTAAPNAQSYIININNPFIVNGVGVGAGVANNSTSAQIFNVTSGNALVFQNDSSANAGTGTGIVTYNNNDFIFFQNTSNAGNTNTTITNNGIVQFNDSSTAGSVQLTNNIQTDFFDSSSAASATITNAAAGTITFNTNATSATATIGNAGTLQFNNASTAAASHITNTGALGFNNSSTAAGATIANNPGGTLDFNDTSTAGAATITNSGTGAITFHANSSAGGAAFTNSGTGAIAFNDTSTAATAMFTNNAGATLSFNDMATAAGAVIGNGGTVSFNTSTSAGSSQITNNAGGFLNFTNASTAGTANILNNATGTTQFLLTSTAGNATINNSVNGITQFFDSATAGSATINNNGGLTQFNNSSSAGSAAITTSAGAVFFVGTSTGGQATFVTNTGGVFDMSGLTSAGMTAGSIAGAGQYFLGARALTVGGNDASTTVSGVISDGGLSGGAGGALIKEGSGTLTLSGTDTYTGATTINGGTLSVTGSDALSSGFTANAGGTLNGTGTVSSVTVNGGGTLMPGLPATVGTLRLQGSLLFASAAAYMITINGAANSKASVTGGATLNSGASVLIASGSTINVAQKYTILTATGGVTGTFNPNVGFGPFKGTLSYDANDVFLTFGFSNLSPLLPAGAPQNVVQVANAVDNFTTGGGMLPPGFISLFNLPPQRIENALTQLSGEVGTGAQLAGFQLMDQFLSLMLDPLAQGHGNGIGPVPFAPEKQGVFTPEVASAYASVLKAPPAAPISSYGPWNAWGAAYGGTKSVSGNPAVVGSHDVTARAGGFAAGLDYRISPDALVGFALAGAGTGWDLAAGLGTGRSDAFQAGVYGARQLGALYVSGALAFSNYWASTSRVVTVAGMDTLNARFDAQSLGGRAEAGYRLRFAPFTLTPYAAAQAQSFHTPTYGETAASGLPQFALSYAGRTSTEVRAELGSWISKNFLLAGGDSIALFGRAAWAHDWDSNLGMTPTFLNLPGASFAMNGAAPPSNLALLTAGAELRLRSQWSLMGRFDGEFASGAQIYTGTARVRYTW